MRIVEIIVNYDPEIIEASTARKEKDRCLAALKRQQRLDRIFGNVLFFGSLGVVITSVNWLVTYSRLLTFLLFIGALTLFAFAMVRALEGQERLLEKESVLKRQLTTPALAYHEAVKDRDVVVCFGSIKDNQTVEVTVITKEKGVNAFLLEHKIDFQFKDTGAYGALTLDVGGELAYCSDAK